MIFYLCQSEFGPCLAGTQADAKKLDRNYEQVDVPTDKQGLMVYINNLMSDGKQRGGPGIIDEAGPVTRDQYEILTGESVKPAFTQEQVDAMFEPLVKDELPDVDTVCHAISSFRGAAIGHVAHELAARIETLAKETVNG